MSPRSPLRRLLESVQRLPVRVTAGMGVFAALSFPLPAGGQTTVWTGSSSTAWNAAGNWSNGVPLSTGIASFSTNTKRDPSLTANAAVGEAVWSGTFRGGAMGGTGYTLTLNGVFSGATNLGLDLQVGRGPSVAPTLALGASQTWQISYNGNGANLVASGGVALNGYTLTLNPQYSANTFTIGSVLSGSGNLLTSGAGTVTLNGTTANTYSGNVTVAGGTLELAKNAGVAAVTGDVAIGDSSGSGTLKLITSEQIADTAAVAMGANGTPTFDLNGQTETIGSLSSVNSSAVLALGSGSLTTGANNTSTSFAGTITGTGDLVKTGTGTLTLTHPTSSYTGITSVNGGVLAIDTLANGGAASAIGSATSAAGNLVLNGGTLRYTGGANSTNRLFSIGTGGGTLDSSGSGALTFSSTGAIGFNSQSGNRSLTLTGAGDGTLAATLGDGGGATSLIKTGAGTWILTANNSFSGGTIVNGGTLQIGNGGTSGAIGTGSVTNNGSLVVNRSDAITAQNQISGTGSVAQIGSGTTTIAIANSFTGGTTINAGQVKLSHAAALGAAGAAVTLGGGSLDLATNTSVNAYNVTLATSSTVYADRATGGSGTVHTLGTLAMGAGQTLDVQPGTNVTGDYGLTFGTTTLGGNATFNITNATTGTGTLTLGTVGQSATGSVTKTGTGTLVYSGNNVYTGTTTVAAGAVIVNSGAQLAGATSGLVMTGGTLNLNNAAQTVASLSGSAGTIALGAAHSLTINESGTDTFGGTFTGGNTTVVTKSGTGTLILTGNSALSGLFSVNQGILQVDANNALGATDANVSVSGGTLALSAGTSLTKTGTLTLGGSGASPSTGALHNLAGSGQTATYAGNIALAANATVSSGSGLLVIGNGNTFANTINLGANTLTFNTPAAATVTPTYPPYPGYVLDPSNLVVYSNISGTGGLTKTGSGTVTLMPVVGGSSFTGATVVTGGRLVLDSNTNVPAVNSTQIYVGNSASPGAADSVALQLGQIGSSPAANNMIGTRNATTNASASSLTIYSDGVFQMNNASNGFVNLTLQGGHVDGGSSVYSPLLTLAGSLTTQASSRTALINHGNLAMSAPDNFTYTIASGSAPGGVDLQIDSIVQNGVGYTGGTAGTSLVKAGTGKMVFTGSNTYSGITHVTAGILNIQHGLALGQGGSTVGDTANGTVVSANAQLQVQGNLTVGGETLTLNGTGLSSDGALRNVGGANTLQGYVYLGSDARINADAGTTLTIANAGGVNLSIMNGTAAGKNLTVGGQGDTLIKGGIRENVGAITKDGTGTLTLAGANYYAGDTQVTGGTLKVTNSNGLSGTGITVANGATLAFAPDAQNTPLTVVAVNTAISGTGTNGAGAIQNLSGNNSFAGIVSLNANALITANSGSALTLSGGTASSAGAGVTLQIGTSAQNGDVTISGVMNNGASVSSASRLTKQGSGALTFAGAGTSTVGAVLLSGGTMAVGAGGSTTLNTGDITAAASTSLLIASGGTVNVTGNAVFNSGTLNGSSGTLQVNGNHTLTFNGTFSAPNLTLVLNGASAGNNAAPLTVYLGGSNLNIGTLVITGDTILDFGNSAGTVLTSGSLAVTNNAQVKVLNWASSANNALLSTIWYATGTLGNATLGSTNQTPTTNSDLGQITFINPQGSMGSTTTWVAETSQGWFDHEIRPTPEPATYGALLMSGCLGLLAWRRHRNDRRSAA